MSWTCQRKACGCGKLPHDTRRVFLRMRARTSARTSVNTLSLFMCEHSVRARSAGPAVRTRTRQCECTFSVIPTIRRDHRSLRTASPKGYFNIRCNVTGIQNQLWMNLRQSLWICVCLMTDCHIFTMGLPMLSSLNRSQEANKWRPGGER